MSSQCVDWYLDTYINGELVDEEYEGTTCPGDTCAQEAIRDRKGALTVGTNCNGGGGNGSSTSQVTINTDTLSKNFPCAVKLILGALLGVKNYTDLVTPFTTSMKPDLIWTDHDLPWNPQGNGNTELGNTGVDPNSGLGLGSLITLNNKMLTNSSKLMIAAVAIHETLHGYINYNVANNKVNNQPNYQISGSWMYSLDAFFTQNSLPSNYADHYQMLSDYFNKGVATLAAFDNDAHSSKEYAMAMLYGLDNSGLDPNDPNNSAEIAQLYTEYLSIRANYNISASDLNTFYTAQLFTSADKLPTDCSQ